MDIKILLFKTIFSARCILREHLADLVNQNKRTHIAFGDRRFRSHEAQRQDCFPYATILFFRDIEANSLPKAPTGSPSQNGGDRHQTETILPNIGSKGKYAVFIIYRHPRRSVPVNTARSCQHSDIIQSNSKNKDVPFPLPTLSLSLQKMMLLVSQTR